MSKKKHVLVLALIFCLATTLFVAVSVGYDAWVDLDDDGDIDADDLYLLANEYGTSGTPINKTELLLDLQERVDSLNASVISLESMVASNKGRIVLIESEITTIHDTISTMQSVMADLQSEVDSLNQTLEARIPKKGYISVPASAFVPWDSDKAASIQRFLVNKEVANLWFYGSVQLPNGATVTKMTFYYYDSGGEYIQCFLRRYNQTDFDNVGYAYSTIGTGYGSDYDLAIDFATVDNSLYAYCLEVRIPPSAGSPFLDYYFQYAIIEYEYSA